MRRILLLVGLWVTATAAAAVVAWAAVGVVGDQVADTVAIPLSAQEVDALGASRSTTTASPGTTTVSSTSSSASSAPVTSSSTSASGGTSTTVGSTSVPATTTSTTAAPTTTAASRGDEQVSAHRVEGGSVVVRWSPSTGVTLVSTSPESGWSVDIDSAGPPQVDLEFKGPDDAESHFSARVSNGELVVEGGD